MEEIIILFLIFMFGVIGLPTMIVTFGASIKALVSLIGNAAELQDAIHSAEELLRNSK